MDSQIRAKSGRGTTSIPGISMDTLMDTLMDNGLRHRQRRTCKEQGSGKLQGCWEMGVRETPR